MFVFEKTWEMIDVSTTETGKRLKNLSNVKFWTNQKLCRHQRRLVGSISLGPNLNVQFFLTKFTWVYTFSVVPETVRVSSDFDPHIFFPMKFFLVFQFLNDIGVIKTETTLTNEQKILIFQIPFPFIIFSSPTSRNTHLFTCAEKLFTIPVRFQVKLLKKTNKIYV